MLLSCCWPRRPPRAARGRRRVALPRARVQRDGGLPARLDRRGGRGDPCARRPQRLRRRRDGGPGRVHRPAARPLRRRRLADHDRRRARRRPAGGVPSATSAAAAATSACTRRPTRSTAGAGTGACSAPASAPPGGAAGDDPRRRSPPPLDAAAAASLAAHGRVVRLPRAPAARGARARDARRVDLLGRLDGRPPPDRLVPPLPGRALLVHRRRPHGGELRRAAVPQPPARRDPLGRRARFSRRPSPTLPISEAPRVGLSMCRAPS